MTNRTLPKTLAFWIVSSMAAESTLRSIGLADEANDFQMKVDLVAMLWSREHGEEFVKELDRLQDLLIANQEVMEAGQC